MISLLSQELNNYDYHNQIIIKKISNNPFEKKILGTHFTSFHLAPPSPSAFKGHAHIWPRPHFRPRPYSEVQKKHYYTQLQKN